MRVAFNYLLLLFVMTLLSACGTKPTSTPQEITESSFSSEEVLPTNEAVMEAVALYRNEHHQSVDSAEYVYHVTYEEENHRYFIEVSENHTDQLVLVGTYLYEMDTDQVIELSDK